MRDRSASVAISNIDPMIVLIDSPTSSVSATQVRERRGRGETIAGLVPDPVRMHIEQHGLYTSSTGRRASDSEPASESGGMNGEN